MEPTDEKSNTLVYQQNIYSQESMITESTFVVQDTLADEAQNVHIDPVQAEIAPSLSKEGIRDNPKGWAVIIASFCVNFFCLGVLFQWGNFQQLYLKIYAGQIDTFHISFVGTIGVSTLLFGGVFVPLVIRKLGYRKTMMLGAILAPLGLLLASFATEIWHICLFYFLFGLGCGFVYSPSMALPSIWFRKKRALATGIASAGSGMGALVISPLTEKMIETIGYRNALRVLASIGFVLLSLAAALAFSNPTQGHHHQQKKRHIRYRELVNNPEFLFAIAYNIICYFGYFPTFFLVPQYTTFLGHSAAEGAGLISVMSGLNSLSRISMGFLADRYGNLNVMILCSLTSGLLTCLLWQHATNYAIYIYYCVFNGYFGGVFVGLMPVMIADIVGVENIQQGLGLCFMAAIIGALTGSPVSGKLLETSGWTAAIQAPGIVVIFSSMILICLRMKQSRGKILPKM